MSRLGAAALDGNQVDDVELSSGARKQPRQVPRGGGCGRARRIPSRLVCREERVLSARDVSGAQANPTELCERPPELPAQIGAQLLTGGKRFLLSLEAGEVADRIPGSRFEMITGAGASHVVPIERPDDFNRLVTRFLAASAATGVSASPVTPVIVGAQERR